MDNESGWAAHEITLTARDQEGQRAHLTLPCRWVELVQAWDGAADAYFLVSGVHADHLTDGDWEFIAFKDAGGKTHRYPIGAVTKDGPRAIRLMRGR
jgi:hypothetical protein